MIPFLIMVSLPHMAKAERFTKSGNTRYFQHIDSHLKAYFVGFIAADGCINKPSRGGQDRLSIGLHIQDQIVLEILKSELNAPNNISNATSTMVQLQISCQELCDDLRQYGIDYRKTLNMPNILPLVPEEFRNSLLLGIMDGDGCIYQQKRNIKYVDGTTKPYYTPTIIFNGSRALLEGIADYLEISKDYVREIKSICEFRVQLKELRERVFTLLYKDCPFYLIRKHNKFVRIE